MAPWLPPGSAGAGLHRPGLEAFLASPLIPADCRGEPHAGAAAAGRAHSQGRRVENKPQTKYVVHRYIMLYHELLKFDVVFCDRFSEHFLQVIFTRNYFLIFL